MSLKLRVLCQNGTTVSATSSIEELLSVLRDGQLGVTLLDRDDEETLRGWLLIRADELENGAKIIIEGDETFCVGKTPEGHSFVRDLTGDWPPIKPIFGESKF